MDAPIFRCGTKIAIAELSEELNLPHEDWMQDWPYEVVVATDIDRYLDHYCITNNDDKKFVLMQAIVQATEEQHTEELRLKYWNIIKSFLISDFHIHQYTIYEWACFDDTNIDDCWAITPLMRSLWIENCQSPLN